MTAFAITHDVLRWHAHPDPRLRNSGDTVNHHQERCERYLIQLFPGASDHLRKIVRVHDEAEKVVGDMPYPATCRFPKMAEVRRYAERLVMLEMGLPLPETDAERAWLKLVDRLDAQLWMLLHAPELADLPEWRVSLFLIEDDARALGCADAVQAIMEAAK